MNTRPLPQKYKYKGYFVQKINRMVDDLVGTLTDHIIVFPGGWGDSLPEWLKNTITLERLTENMKSTKGGEPTGTDAEACAYLNTASLTMPLDSDWSQIYLYVAGTGLTVCTRVLTT